MPKRNIVTISLPDDILKQLEAAAKEGATSRSDIVRRSLMTHFFTNDLTKARRRTINELSKRGVHLTDDEVFDRVS